MVGSRSFMMIEPYYWGLGMGGERRENFNEKLKIGSHVLGRAFSSVPCYI